MPPLVSAIFPSIAGVAGPAAATLGGTIGAGTAAAGLGSSLLPALALGGTIGLGDYLSSKEERKAALESSLPGRSRVPLTMDQLSLSQKLAKQFQDYGNGLNDVRAPLNRFGIDYGKIGDLQNRIGQYRPGIRGY